MNGHELKYLIIIAVLLTLSFPPFPFGFLAPTALAIFLLLIQDQSPKDCFRLGYWFGLLWGAMALFWISTSSVTGAILAILINSLHYAIIWWLFSNFRKRSLAFALISLPAIWVGMEYLRQFSDLRFNWLTLAHTQSYYLSLIQFIDITGYYAISFIVVSVGVSIFVIIRFKSNYRWIPISACMVVIIILSVYGQIQISKFHKIKYPLLKAGLVQPNVDPYEKWDPVFQGEAFDMLMEASRKLLDSNPNLIIWPETATPFYLRSNPGKIRQIQLLIDSANISLLTGTPDYQYMNDEGDYHTYNATFFLSSGGKTFQKYYKMALVPGSETMPFKTYFPFLRKVDVGGGDFFPGMNYTVFKFSVRSGQGKFSNSEYKITELDKLEDRSIGLSAIICYESVFPDIVRRFVLNGSNLLTIITNDGWFGLTSGPYQHAQFAVFRAIENRVSILRCANTGISCFIDPTGKILKKAGLNTRKNLSAFVPVNDKKSFYTRNGDLFGKIMFLMSWIFIFVKLFL